MMPFSYMEEKDEIEKIVRGESKAEAAEEELAGDSSRKDRNRHSRPVEEKSAANSTREVKQSSEHVCESCLEDFGIRKPAFRKVRMSGQEEWLCDSCLQAAGYKEELD